MPSIDPSTGEPWALTAFGGVRDIDRAVEAAQEAMRGPWGRMPVAERAALMRRLGALIEENAPRMAELEAATMAGRCARPARTSPAKHSGITISRVWRTSWTAG